MTVGTEWLIDAEGCNANALRDLSVLTAVVSQVVEDLGLKTLGEANWHNFDGEGGITGLIMLTESHLACHTYPENRTATFNLYCCRSRPEWDWEGRLKELLGAENVKIQKIVRGSTEALAAA